MCIKPTAPVIYLSVRLSVCPSVRLSVCLSVRPSATTFGFWKVQKYIKNWTNKPKVVTLRRRCGVLQQSQLPTTAPVIYYGSWLCRQRPSNNLLLPGVSRLSARRLLTFSLRHIHRLWVLQAGTVWTAQKSSAAISHWSVNKKGTTPI